MYVCVYECAVSTTTYLNFKMNLFFTLSRGNWFLSFFLCAKIHMTTSRFCFNMTFFFLKESKTFSFELPGNLMKHISKHEVIRISEFTTSYPCD